MSGMTHELACILFLLIMYIVGCSCDKLLDVQFSHLIREKSDNLYYYIKQLRIERVYFLSFPYLH
jgi:hypothetical protein